MHNRMVVGVRARNPVTVIVIQYHIFLFEFHYQSIGMHKCNKNKLYIFPRSF